MINGLSLDWPSEDHSALLNICAVLTTEGFEVDRFLELCSIGQPGGLLVSYFRAICFALKRENRRFVEEILKCFMLVIQNYGELVRGQVDDLNEELETSDVLITFFHRGPWFFQDGKILKCTLRLPS